MDNIDFLLTAAENLSAELQSACATCQIGSVEMPVSFTWTDDPKIELSDEELRNPLVWVIDWAFDAHTENNDCPVEIPQLLIIVQKKILPNELPADVHRAMSELTAKIATFLRPRDEDYQLTVGSELVPCVKVERPHAKDFDKWRKDRAYFSEIIAHFKRY